MGVATLLTREEFLALPNADDYELIEGELRERVEMSIEAGIVGLNIGGELRDWNTQAAAGVAFGDGIGLDLFERNYVPRPDGGFISKSRIAGQDLSGNFHVAPELVYEVISPGNKSSDTEAKVMNYLSAGIDTVWVLYPGTRRIHVFRRGERPEILGPEDTLTSELLPGFSAPVAMLFPPID